MDLVFHPGVQADLRSIVAYYEVQRGSVLSNRFFAEVEATLNRIANHPSRFKEIGDGLQKVSLRLFPYNILFRDRGTFVCSLLSTIKDIPVLVVGGEESAEVGHL